MIRPARLHNRLIIAFIAVTLAPVCLTVWLGVELLNRSLQMSPIDQFDTVSRSYEKFARELYQRSRQQLRADVARGALKPEIFADAQRDGWPSDVADFADSGQQENYSLDDADGNRLELLERKPGAVYRYTADLGPFRMNTVAKQLAEARQTIESARSRDLRRGFVSTLVLVSAAVWIVGMAGIVYWARRIAQPVHHLTAAMQSVAAGNLAERLHIQGQGEIGDAIRAFNEMAERLERSRDKLVHVTRLASWQALARKTAHEVKNSLTPIRLTMEELVARQGSTGDPFLRDAAEIVVDEVVSLEKRVRAFSDFASEPPVEAERIDANAAIDDRIALLRAGKFSVLYDLHLDPARPQAFADPDLLKAVLTNLLENAAQAAGEGGVVRVRSRTDGGKVAIEVHDSGPGLSAQARATIFEPTISFKKGGMGLGLSIARKSAVLCGGDISLIAGELGGAGFVVTLPAASPAAVEQDQPAPQFIAHETHSRR